MKVAKNRAGSTATRGPEEFYAIAPTTLLNDPRLNATAVRVFLVLDSRQTTSSRVRVSQSTLAADINASPRAVQYAIRQLVAAGYLNVQRTGRTNGYRVNNPARDRAVDRAAARQIVAGSAPTETPAPEFVAPSPGGRAAKREARAAAIAAAPAPTITPAPERPAPPSSPPEWFQESPAPAPAVPAALLDGLSAALADDRRGSVDLSTAASTAALVALTAAGWTATDIAAELNSVDLANARNVGGLLAARLKSAAASGKAPAPAPAPKPQLPPAHRLIVSWGFRSELAPLAAELDAWEAAGGSIYSDPFTGITLEDRNGRRMYQIAGGVTGEATVTHHLTGTDPVAVPVRSLSRAVEEIRSLRLSVLPVKVSREEWAAMNGMTEAEFEAMMESTDLARTEEIVFAVTSALAPTGDPADRAGRDALADLIHAADPPEWEHLQEHLASVGESVRIDRDTA